MTALFIHCYRATSVDGERFWGDSRDHFDEKSVEGVLARSDVFSVDQWWTSQGLDSGILLVDKSQCFHELLTLATIAQSQKRYQALQQLSMGDKDLFRVAWMIRERAFAMVPYIGELGSFNSAGAWSMTSQLKHDAHGRVVALHQRHRGSRGTHAARQDLRRSGGNIDFAHAVQTGMEDVEIVTADILLLAATQAMDEGWRVRRRASRLAADAEGAVIAAAQMKLKQ